MHTIIRYFFVSFYFPYQLVAMVLQFPESGDYDLASKSQLLSQISIPDSSLKTSTRMSIRGKLSIKENHERTIFSWTLEDATLTVEGQQGITSYSMEEPSHSIEMCELKILKNRPIEFELLEQPPFVKFSEEFEKQFGDFKLVKSEVLAGFLGEDLQLLKYLTKCNLSSGEGFELNFPKNDRNSVDTNKTIVIKDITATHILLEVTTIVDRQKISGASEDVSVVLHQSKAIWEITKNQPFQLKITEKGTFSQTSRLGDAESRKKQELERQISLRSSRLE